MTFFYFKGGIESSSVLGSWRLLAEDGLDVQERPDSGYWNLLLRLFSSLWGESPPYYSFFKVLLLIA